MLGVVESVLCHALVRRIESKEIEHYDNGEPEKKSLVIVAALQNFEDNLTEHGQYVDFKSLEKCTELFKGAAVIVMGDDSVVGY